MAGGFKFQLIITVM